MQIKKIFIWLIVASPILYISTCTIISSKKDKAFNTIGIGDSQEKVIKILGNPSVRENPYSLFARYASSKCRNPCAERLWFENELAIGIEAWSVELDNQNRVTDKAHWVLP
jgi:protein involved in sex pheromone biosynthesis